MVCNVLLSGMPLQSCQIETLNQALPQIQHHLAFLLFLLLLLAFSHKFCNFLLPSILLSKANLDSACF